MMISGGPWPVYSYAMLVPSVDLTCRIVWPFLSRGLIAACCPARIGPERAGRQDRRKGNQGSHRHE
jgi:hypothetical protein